MTRLGRENHELQMAVIRLQESNELLRKKLEVLSATCHNVVNSSDPSKLTGQLQQALNKAGY